jgi:nitrite reductase (NADH) large subunit
MKIDYLCIGNGVASNSAVNKIREKDKNSSIAIVGDEEFDFYYRPQLPDYLLERVDDEKIVSTREEEYKNKNIRVIKSCKVVTIEPGKKRVKLDDGEELEYGKLLIATGLSPFKSPVGFQSLGEVKKLKEIISRVNEVVVAGEYIFLLELVRALIALNKKIIFLCKGKRLLEDLLDERASWHLEQLLISNGVNLLYHTEIEKVDISPEGKYLIHTRHPEKTGQRKDIISCDIYFLADYEEKNKDMFINAGLEYAEAGIWIDRYMRTNIKDIYAAGDVARVRNGYPPNILRVGWQRAKLQGEIAGENMAGGNIEFNPFSTAIHIRFGRINFLFAGELAPTLQGCAEDIVLESLPDNYYKRVHIQDGVVKGFVFVGGTRGLARVKELLAEGYKLSESEKFVLQKDLVEGYGDTISLQMACPVCKTILDLPITVEVGEKVICEVCGAESVVSRTRVSMVKYLELR